MWAIALRCTAKDRRKASVLFVTNVRIPGNILLLTNRLLYLELTYLSNYSTSLYQCKDSILNNFEIQATGNLSYPGLPKRPKSE